MSINPLAVDAAFTTDRRGLYYGISISLCVHVFAYHLFSQTQAFQASFAAGEVRSPLSVRLVSSKEPAKKTIQPQSLEELFVLSNRKPRLASALPPDAPKVGAQPPKLRTSSEIIWAAIRDQDNANIPEKSLSDNGATVINSDLLKILNKAVRRQGGMAKDRFLDVNSSFSHGAWSDFVQIGDSCFRVIQRNPLEPMSRETWYAVKCRG